MTDVRSFGHMPVSLGHVVDERTYGVRSTIHKPRFQLINVKVLTILQRRIDGVATLVGLFGPVIWAGSGGDSVLRPVCHDKRANQPKRDSRSKHITPNLMVRPDMPRRVRPWPRNVRSPKADPLAKTHRRRRRQTKRAARSRVGDW